MSGRRISSAALAAMPIILAAMFSATRAQTVINLSQISTDALLQYSSGVLVIGGADGLADGVTCTVTGSVPSNTPVDSIYIRTAAGANVNITWTASISTSNKTRRALVSVGNIGSGVFIVNNAAITAGAGSAVSVNGSVAIVNSDITGNATLAPLVWANAGNTYIANSTIGAIGSGAEGVAVSAADTAFILSGAITGRKAAVSAGKGAFIDNCAAGSAPNVSLFGAMSMGDVRIEADSAVVNIVNNAGRVVINNPSAVIINRPDGVSAAIAERGAAIRAGSVEIAAVDSIAAMGIGTAIHVANNAVASTIASGIIHSESGTAIRSIGASVTIDGNTAVISNASGTGAAIPNFGAIRIETAAAAAALNIIGSASIRATGLSATAVHAHRGGAGALTVTIGDNSNDTHIPAITSADGSAVSVNNGATLNVVNGNLSNSSTNSLPVISASGNVPANTDVVTVGRGRIIANETSGGGAAVRVSGNGGVTVDGEVEIVANGTNGRAIQTESGQVTVAGAVTMRVHEGALSVGIQTTTGEVTVRNAEIGVTNGVGIHTAGGAVTVNASPGQTAAVRATVGGSAIRAVRPAGGRAGTVRIGGSAGDKSVTVSSAFGRAIFADDSVRVLDYANVVTRAGKAIVGGHVVIGTISDGAAPTVAAIGGVDVDTAAAVTIPAVAGSAGSVTVTGGRITAGTPHPTIEGDAEFTADAITVVGTIAGAIRINSGSVEAHGPVTSIKSASPNIDIFIGSVDGGAPIITTGNNGTAIAAAGRFQMDGGMVWAGDGSDSRAINITGGKTLLIRKGTVSVGNNGIAINSAAAVVDSIIGSGSVTVRGRGVAVNALGRVIVGDDAVITVNSGTALSSPGDITLAGGAVHSADTCIASTREVRIVGNNVRLSGIIDADVGAVGAVAVVSAGGTAALGRAMVIPAGKSFNLTQRATLAAYAHDTIMIYGSVSTAGATEAAGGYFENSGKVVVASGANVAFGPYTKATLENKGGLFVLSTGASFNGAPIDYAAWADTLSNFDLRGPGSVMIPPIFADSDDVWGVDGSITAEVFSVVSWQLPLSENGGRFMGEPITFSLASGDFPEGAVIGGAALSINDNGRIAGLLTGAGEYRFTARAENEAGFAEKNYSVTVTRATATPEAGIHFAAQLSLGSDERTLGAGTAAASLKYAGAPVRAEVAGINIAGYNTPYSGFGKAAFWWREETDAGNEGGADNNDVTDIFERLTQTPPENVGTYTLFISLAQGRNFDAANDASEPIELGKLTITASTLAEILGEIEVVREIDLLAGLSGSVTVNIPNVTAYGAKYDPLYPVLPAFSTAANPADIIVGGSAWVLNDSLLMFNALGSSVPGDQIIFVLDVFPNTANNVIEGSRSRVTVRIFFKHENDIAVAEADRVIFDIGYNEEIAVVNRVIGRLPTVFTAGPNPAARSSASHIVFFRQGGNIADGTITVYDASGSVVKRIDIADNAATAARREIGRWDLTDTKGRVVPAGTYLAKGVINTRDGKREKVSHVIGVR